MPPRRRSTPAEAPSSSSSSSVDVSSLLGYVQQLAGWETRANLTFDDASAFHRLVKDHGHDLLHGVVLPHVESVYRRLCASFGSSMRSLSGDKRRGHLAALDLIKIELQRTAQTLIQQRKILDPNAVNNTLYRMGKEYNKVFYQAKDTRLSRQSGEQHHGRDERQSTTPQSKKRKHEEDTAAEQQHQQQPLLQLLLQQPDQPQPLAGQTSSRTPEPHRSKKVKLTDNHDAQHQHSSAPHATVTTANHSNSTHNHDHTQNGHHSTNGSGRKGKKGRSEPSGAVGSSEAASATSPSSSLDVPAIPPLEPISGLPSLASLAASAPRSGTLRTMAREIFCRAYGLVGRPREDHSQLVEHVVKLTNASRGHLYALLYGTMFEELLADLRAMVPAEQRDAYPTIRAGTSTNGHSSNRLSSDGASDNGQTEDPVALAKLRPISRELFERYFGLNLYRGKPESCNKVTAGAIRRTGCHATTVTRMLCGGLFEELDDLRRLLSPYQRKQQYGMRMMNFDYRSKHLTADPSNPPVLPAKDAQPLQSATQSTSNAPPPTAATPAPSPTPSPSSNVSSSQPSSVHLDCIFDSRTTTGGDVEYYTQLCTSTGDVTERIWLKASAPALRQRPDLIEKFEQTRSERLKATQEKQMMAALDDLAAAGAAHGRRAPQEGDGDDDDDDDGSIRQARSHIQSKKTRRRVVESDSESSRDESRHNETTASVSNQRHRQDTNSQPTTIRVKSEVSSPVKAASSSSLPPSIMDQVNEGRQLSEKERFLERREAERRAQKENDARAQAKDKTTADHDAAAKEATASGGDRKSRRAAKEEAAKLKAKEEAARAAAEAASIKEKEEKARKKAEKREKKRQEAEAEAKAKAEAVARACAEMEEKKKAKKEKRQREREREAEKRKVKEEQEKKENERKKQEEAEKAKEKEKEKQRQKEKEKEKERELQRARHEQERQREEERRRLLQVEEEKARKRKQQIEAEVEAERKKAEQERLKQQQQQKAKEERKAEEKRKQEEAKKAKSQQQVKTENKLPQTPKQEVKPAISTPLSPSLSAATPVASRSILSQAIDTLPHKPTYILLDTVSVARWAGSGEATTLTHPSTPARHGTGASSSAPRFESWQVAAAIRAVEQQLAGQSIAVTALIPERFQKQPDENNVQDVWVLLELQRQMKLHRVPDAADLQLQLIGLAAQPGNETFIISNDSFNEHLTSGLITAEWRDRHVLRFFSFSGLRSHRICENCAKLSKFWMDRFQIDPTSGAVQRKGHAPSMKTDRECIKKQWYDAGQNCCMSCRGQIVLIAPPKPAATLPPPATPTPNTPASSSSKKKGKGKGKAKGQGSNAKRKREDTSPSSAANGSGSASSKKKSKKKRRR